MSERILYIKKKCNRFFSHLAPMKAKSVWWFSPPQLWLDQHHSKLCYCLHRTVQLLNIWYSVMPHSNPSFLTCTLHSRGLRWQQCSETGLPPWALAVLPRPPPVLAPLAPPSGAVAQLLSCILNRSSLSIDRIAYVLSKLILRHDSDILHSEDTEVHCHRLEHLQTSLVDTVRFSFSTHSATSTVLDEIVSFAIYAFPINYRQTVDISPTVFLFLMSSIVWVMFDSSSHWLMQD